MKKGKKLVALLLALATAGVITAGIAACDGNGNDSNPEGDGKQEQSAVAEKLKDGDAIVFTEGTSIIDLSQYIHANGNSFLAVCSNPKVATVVLSGSTLTVTAKREGTAMIMVSCGDVKITFSVSAPKVYYTITLDGEPVVPAEGEKWESGLSYVLPEAKTSEDFNMEFKAWDVNGVMKRAGEKITVDQNLTITAVFERKAAQEVSGHSKSISLREGNTVNIKISDYMISYGRKVSVMPSDPNFITVNVTDDNITISGVAIGNATLTLSTEGMAVELSVHIISADMPTFADGSIDIDLFTATSGSFTFAPQEPAVHDYVYEYSLETLDARASILGTKLIYSAGEDYDLEEDGNTVELTVNVAVTIDGISSGNVTFSVFVHLTDTTPAAPSFSNVLESFDSLSEDTTKHSYTLVFKAEDETFTYAYAIGSTPVSGSKIYTATTRETVNVTYTYRGNTQKSGTAEFSVVIYDIKDARIENGGFETGDMTGWTSLTDGLKMENCVRNETSYWDEQLPYNHSGDYHLNGVGIDMGIAEADVWGVRSTNFILGGSGWITLKMGGRTAGVKVFKSDGTLIGTYRANHFNDSGFPDVTKGSWADMRTYAIDLSEYMGEMLYLELWDIEAGGNWGLAIFDDVITYYETAPDWENAYDTVTNSNNLGEAQLPWRKAEKQQ